MQILMISQFMPPFVGGIQAHIQQLTEHLRDHGHEVDWLEGARSDHGIGRFLPGSLPKFHQYDLVHFHGFERLLFASVVLRRPRALVITPHGGISAPAQLDGVTYKIKTAFDQLFGVRLLQKWGNRIIALHEQECEHLRRAGVNPAKIDIIPNGVTVMPVDSPCGAKSEPYLLFVGRIVPEKRLDFAIEALASTKAVLLRIVGPFDKRERQRLQAIARSRNVESRVEFLGPKYGAEKTRLQANAVANVLFSDYDHQPLSILESIACGTPSIARPVGGVPDLARRFPGMIYMVDSPREAAVHAQDLLTTKHVSRKTPIGFERLMENVSWESVVSAVEGTYRNAVQGLVIA